MKAEVKYFGMIAEKIGLQEESIDLNEQNQSDLRMFFEKKHPNIIGMNYQIAINQTLTEKIESNLEFVEIALLPPFAGG